MMLRNQLARRIQNIFYYNAKCFGRNSIQFVVMNHQCMPIFTQCVGVSASAIRDRWYYVYDKLYYVNYRDNAISYGRLGAICNKTIQNPFCQATPENVENCRLPVLHIMEKKRSSSFLKSNSFFKSSRRKYSSSETSGEQFIINYVEVTTCMQFYSTKPELDQPINGATFNVAYIDTMPDASKSVPIALALHGTPGRNLHFREIFSTMKSENIRIIAPDFPGWGLTEMEDERDFQHTPWERACFVEDFLAALKIGRVDVLISHSSAIYPSLYLCSAINAFKSLVIINPGSHVLVKMLKPAWFYATGVKLARISLLRPLSFPIIKYLVGRISKAEINPSDWLRGAEALISVRFHQIPGVLHELAVTKLPMVLIVSKDDTMVDIEDSLDMATLIDLEENNFTIVDKDGNIKRKGVKASEDKYLEGYMLENGTHFGMRTRPELVAKIIKDITAHVRSKY